MLKTRLLAIVLLLVAILPPSAAFGAKGLFSTATGGTLKLGQLVDELSDAQIIIFGERHNDTDDHTAQRTLLQALNDAGYKMALGLEMFRADAQPMLDSWIAGTMSEADFAIVYANNWDARYFSIYHPLFYYARQEGIRLVGLNIPRDLPSKVGKDGFDSLSRGEKELVGELNCDIDENYKAILSRAMGEKKGDPVNFGRFCEAQVLWDASMAANAVKFMKANPKHKLLIIAGTYHAWKYGIPEQLARAAGFSSVVILPSDDAAFVNYKIISEQADYIWNTQ